MQALLSFITLFFLATGCQSSGSTVQADNDSLVNIEVKDTLPVAPIPRPYSTIEYEKKELITAAGGTKSVLFNSSGTKLYAMNLEGMSVYEFDQASRKLTREFKIKVAQSLHSRKNRWKPVLVMMI